MNNQLYVALLKGWESKSAMEQKSYQHHFQPIVNMNNQHIIGFEALLRVKKFTTPEMLFENAIHTNRLLELDFMSIEKALQTFFQKHANDMSDIYLFINVYPSTVTSLSFYNHLKRMLSMFPSSLNNIVFELNELEAITHYGALREAMERIRQLRVKFALDDFGEGLDSLKKAIELEPDYVKLDKYFAHKLSRTERKQQLLRMILQYFSSYNIDTIIEGIEHEEDLHAAKSLGIQLGQGYLFGKPAKLECFFK